jgi:acyl-CoA synthetase (AMP-forming)/AMP-acid ligase II
VQYRTVGHPQHGVELRVVDETGEPVPAGEVGRITLRSSCAMRGYWDEPGLTAAAMSPDRWLRTGDLGHLDPNGNVVLVGRATDMYIRGGYNVYPLEVENVLAEHPRVNQASVLGVPAPVIGEIGVAFVVPADRSRRPDPAEVIGWCRQRLTDYKAPDRVLIVDDLPLTPMLKVDKAALREQLAGSGDDKKVTAPDR